MNGVTLGLLGATITCVAWGLADYVAALLSRRLGEAWTLLGIQAVGLPILALIWLIIRPPLPVPADLIWITLASGCFAVGYFSFFHGLRVGTISLVSPISSAGALIPVAVGMALMGEEASGIRLTGIALTMAGLALLLTDLRAVKRLDAPTRRRGMLAGLVTLLAWGLGTALLLPAIHHAGGFAPIAILRIEVLVVAAAWCAAASPAAPPHQAPVSSALRSPAVWALVVPAALLDLTAFFAYGYALHIAPASVAAPVASAYPLVTILIAHQRVGETLNAREWSGVALTLLGVGLLGLG
ncbi:MAG: EamA family transporter [Nitrospiria bacterium]